MNTKLLEDLIALSREGSFARAAHARHVTPPAFGRRIRELEAWTGRPLVDRSRGSIRLTAAGQTLLRHASGLVDALAAVRLQLQDEEGDAARLPLRLGTGRTLARTLVADWVAAMARPRKPLHRRPVNMLTGSMAETSGWLERGEADLICCYEHPACSVKLDTQRYRHLTFANDKLVPVSRRDARGRPLFVLQQAPVIAYAGSLSLGALLGGHLARNHPDAAFRTLHRCDSADAIHALARHGQGVAWLPWSMVAQDCRLGVLAPLGGRSEEVHFEVRLYRRRARMADWLEALWAAAES